ncbi:DUF4159 domain-containing protein [Maricaulis parjimensis]|uniref:DUF4159 domain-containing protein n=1 Tax=Maricaulis parjimensis TaxID=144023 RepID=UPI0019398A90|nr:DUF4159 domain-containing protein [Maricaulis parjimensis]
MFALGPLSFAAPLALAGLLALPALWFLLRATPPAPRRAIFPPLRLLLGAPDDAETPQHAPWWLILFRLLIAALIIIALARPVWTPPSVENETRPALIVLDNGWGSAAAWSDLQREANRLIDEADREGRPVALATTAETGQAHPTLRLADADTARRILETAEPQSWPADRDNLADRVMAARENGELDGELAVTWLSDGLASPDDARLARTLSQLGDLRVLEPDSGRAALAIAPPETSADGFTVDVRRAPTDLPRTVGITAIGSDGRALARRDVTIEAGSGSATANISLPLDLRNRIASLRLDGSASAAAVHLLGDSWQRPRVGLIELTARDGQPLLSDLHYIQSALTDRAELIRGHLDDLLAAEPSILIMTDEARSDDERIETFVNEGGVLIRFAGPRLAARGDDLLPVELREGGRLFGGALNWEEPQNLADFPAGSPFSGLPVDRSATVDRQVLAQPGSATPDKVWARLEDGTPLVTAERRARGWIVLFHVTASPEWSDLPLTGLFPRMMQRLMGLAQGSSAATPANGAWVLDRALDAQGQLANAPASARPVPADALANTRPSPATPPGLYRLGPASSALNVIQDDTRVEALPRDLPGAVFAGLDGPRPIRFDASLLAAALVLLALDVLVALLLAGRLANLRIGGAAAAVLLGLAALPGAPQARAQDAPSDDSFAMEAALALRFAYVRTGDAALDQRSEAGLVGLSREITRRSAMEPSEPMGVNIDTDPLLFFPLIYWPVATDAQPLAPETAERVSAYLQSGGLIVFDTQDADVAMLRAGAPHPGLINVLESIDVPPLAQIPPDHVLTRAFYLLQEFPGRYSGSPVWVEANPNGASRDGTSGVIIGAHDWASAWAQGDRGEAMAPVEGGERQREMAVRFGVNIAMYALTGNYKADQVHVPDILERLGQ